MKKRINNCFSLSVLLLILGCTSREKSNEQNIRELLSGEYAKLWVFKMQDSLDCHCYYEIIYKSGKMNHLLRDRRTGIFISFFNDLSGDVLNNDKSWKYRTDTLTLMGYDYKILNISPKRDTIALELIHEFQKQRKYYLIDSKLLDTASLTR